MNSKKIDMFESCAEKSRCNCFNKDARYIWGYAEICSIIYHYKKEIEMISDEYEERVYYLNKKIEIIESISGVIIGDLD